MPFAIDLWAFAAFLALGAAAGILAGLLGVGGGLVLVAALAWLLPAQGVVPAEQAMHAALATSLSSIVFTAMASAHAHAKRGSVIWPTVAWMLPGVLLGGWLGSRMAVDVDGRWLRYGVAGYCLIAAAQMLLAKSKAGGDAARQPQGAGMTLAGGGIGLVSAFVGIGGGSMTVPLLTWLGVAPVRAVGSSSALGIFIGLASALGYASNAPAGALPQHAVGYVYLPAAIGVALASVLIAPLGARIAHAISGPALKRCFALFLLAVGTSLLW